MTYPENGPATLEAVKAHLSVTDTHDDESLTLVVRAVNAFVVTLPAATVAADAPDWSGDALAGIVLGAVMLAGRLHRRRSTPDGVAAFNGEGVAYVMRNDPDVAMLLGLGSWARPAVG